MTHEQKLKDFREALHGTLTFSMNECLKTNWLEDAEIDNGYIISDYFDNMADIITDIRTVAHFYENYLLYNDSILTYAISQDIDDFDITELSIGELRTLKEKIFLELEKRETFEKPLSQVLIDNNTPAIGRIEIRLLYDDWHQKIMGENKIIKGDLIRIDTIERIDKPEKTHIVGYTDNEDKLDICLNIKKEDI